MKLKNIYILLLAAASFVACSDDEVGMNTNGSATVNMGQSEVSARENSGIFNVPVTVEGERNGLVRVEVEVAETGTTPAMDDVHYYVTSKSIVIPADATGGNIEIAAVNDDEINEARTFTITIVKAEGAEIGSQPTTTVTLRDEDSNFYEKLKGNWTIQGINANSGGAVSWSGTITGMEEGEEGYGEVLYINGWGGNPFTATMLYDYDIATQTGTLQILYGTLMGSNLNFGDPVGVCDVYAGTIEGNNIVIPDGTIDGTWSDDFNTLTFEPEKSLWGWLAPAGTTTFNGYLGFAIEAITLTR